MSAYPKKELRKADAFVFGAGVLGAQAYEALKDQYNVLGFVDNDLVKQGSTLKNLPVYPPTQILPSEDALVFIASEFYEQIRRQLIDELSISEKRVKRIPVALQAKMSFGADAEKVKVSLLLLKTCCDHLRSLSAFHHIDAGTLLGLYRDKTLIPWDDDLDIAIDSRDVEKVNNSIERLLGALSTISETEWSCSSAITNAPFGNVPSGAVRSFKLNCEDSRNLPSIDFFVKYRGGGFSDYCLASRGIRMASAHTTDTVLLKVLDAKYPIPSDTDGYLREHYGHWEVPNPNWTLQDLTNSTVFK
ncbi:nucleoside-diphosphate sugar epimerase/dehydratase [Alteromonas oceanisediminis]|uniref:nucleoside-diphosphate sugar epimerase/dehydratase n=1 Tax=Alteromonas oceanisediminis TaxID=2836180 RepID=UPI001BDB392D|nr:LicD family protein [Alteromonas oceanisediminis]MBT0584942.1 LicD family protein [Alteromonas oceanisediminis]